MASKNAVDARALREELAIQEPADLSTPDFMRLVIRLSQALNFDIPIGDRRRLTTLRESMRYIQEVSR